MNILEEMASEMKIGILQSTIKSLEERLKKTEDIIKNILADGGVVEETVSELEERIDDLESKVSDLQSEAEDWKEELKDTTEKVDNLEDTSNLEESLNESIRDLEDRVQTEIEDLKSDMESSVDDMKLEVKKLDWIKRIVEPVQEKVEPSQTLLPL